MSMNQITQKRGEEILMTFTGNVDNGPRIKGLLGDVLDVGSSKNQALII